MNMNKKNFEKLPESFKHRVIMDPKNADETWKIVEQAIHRIYNHNASGLNFEQLY
ncbi:cullin-3A-like, partial [Trifolium medium]|nr:cullin-3A-like [Trifolium medium]